MEIRFTVPGEPKPKARPRFRVVNKKDGGSFVSTYSTKQTQSEEGAIRHFSSLAMQGGAPLEGPVEMQVCAFLPIPASFSKKKRQEIKDGLVFPTSRPDADNYAKLLMDALNGICYRDDSQVVTLSVYKRYSTQPRLSVQIKPLARNN